MPKFLLKTFWKHHNPYPWQSHQVWGFFTFVTDLAHCAPIARLSAALPPQKYVHSSTNYTLTDTSSSLLRSGSSSLKTGKESGKCIFASCGWLGGHSKTTWTNFDPILTTYPPSSGQLWAFYILYLPFVRLTNQYLTLLVNVVIEWPPCIWIFTHPLGRFSWYAWPWHG